MTDVAPIDDAGLARLRELYAAATPGEWGFDVDRANPSALVAGTDEHGAYVYIWAEADEPSGPWVAESHNAFPALLARLDAAETKLSRVVSVGHNDDCMFCGFKDREANR